MSLVDGCIFYSIDWLRSEGESWKWASWGPAHLFNSSSTSSIRWKRSQQYWNYHMYFLSMLMRIVRTATFVCTVLQQQTYSSLQFTFVRVCYCRSTLRLQQG